MLARTRKMLPAAALCGAGFLVGICVTYSIGAADAESGPLKSQVVRWDDAPATVGDWGEMRRYFGGQTFGTKHVLTAVAVIEPGKTIHRAHRHAEEEYLAVVQGSGTWSLSGKEIPAEKGDILYAEPWYYHGVTNTGEEDLIILVVRYHAKGVDLPPKPDDRPDEL